MTVNVDAALMTLLTAYLYPSVYAVKCWCCADDAAEVLIYVKGWPVQYNFRCVYLPLVWRSYQPSCLLPSRPCLYSKIRCVYMLIYVSRCPVLYNVSYVVFTTYAVCTSPWCGEIIFPRACFRADRVCVAIEWVSCLWLIYCLRHQTLGGERVVFIFLAERTANAVNRKCTPVCVFLILSTRVCGQILSLCWSRRCECYLHTNVGVL